MAIFQKLQASDLGGTHIRGGGALIQGNTVHIYIQANIIPTQLEKVIRNKTFMYIKTYPPPSFQTVADDINYLDYTKLIV